MQPGHLSPHRPGMGVTWLSYLCFWESQPFGAGKGMLGPAGGGHVPGSSCPWWRDAAGLPRAGHLGRTVSILNLLDFTKPCFILCGSVVLAFLGVLELFCRIL